MFRISVGSARLTSPMLFDCRWRGEGVKVGVRITVLIVLEWEGNGRQ